LSRSGLMPSIGSSSSRSMRRNGEREVSKRGEPSLENSSQLFSKSETQKRHGRRSSALRVTCSLHEFAQWCSNHTSVQETGESTLMGDLRGKTQKSQKSGEKEEEVAADPWSASPGRFGGRRGRARPSFTTSAVQP
jgi:hypothetical protein